jgi:perosamine synthetase
MTGFGSTSRGLTRAQRPRRTNDLALLGGHAAVPRHLRRVEWPVVTDDDRGAVARALSSGRLVSNAQGETAVADLERRWAESVGVEHCVGVGTGTAALSLALSALGIGAGDEVIVPALSFIASGLAALHVGASPVFVDIDPVTFNLDVADLAAKLTPRTAAVIAVHLHGLPADMTAINRMAAAHGLAVVEDAAQAHGARLGDHLAGNLGDAAAFSIGASKNLPTCGEGGLITTNDASVAVRTRRMREFGEAPDPSGIRNYVSHGLGWNHKLAPVQAAFAASQLDRFDDYKCRRDRNVRTFLGALEALPGLTVPKPPLDGTHAWHILRMRLDPQRAGLHGTRPGAFRAALHRVLRAEGVPVSRYQIMPLPAQHVFRCGATVGRVLPSSAPDGADWRASFPTTTAVIEDSMTLQKRQLNPETGPLLECYADAFHKVWEHLDTIEHIATTQPEDPR